MIQILSHEDVLSVSSLHHKELPGFLSKLGVSFLEKFYKASLKVPDMFTFVYKKEGEIVGFATGVETTKGLLKKIIMRDPLGFLGVLFSVFILSPSKLLGVLKALMYPGLNENNAELLSIAVDLNHQREGIGKKLFQEVVREFKKRNIKTFKVSIYDDMSANSFYKKIGCKEAESFAFMGKTMKYYKYTLIN